MLSHCKYRRHVSFGMLVEHFKQRRCPSQETDKGCLKYRRPRERLIAPLPLSSESPPSESKRPLDRSKNQLSWSLRTGSLSFCSDCAGISSLVELFDESKDGQHQISNYHYMMSWKLAPNLQLEHHYKFGLIARCQHPLQSFAVQKDCQPLR